VKYGAIFWTLLYLIEHTKPDSFKILSTEFLQYWTILLKRDPDTASYVIKYVEDLIDQSLAERAPLGVFAFLEPALASCEGVIASAALSAFAKLTDGNSVCSMKRIPVRSHLCAGSAYMAQVQYHQGNRS
jgi:hypothetical protein